ncbi:hypothetical protein KC340_g6975 [Hortaea werneckii]|nr:hypothetical protein KC342_g6782 [Hortaea werneckii]KAI7101755.1 hypothetical protein KC339_g6514 [Hortaea werneckii]KAI7234703.1 hypothetical protein KC365_g5869 [Hortaea werneckii]KAI7322609.1 hypothetical protein KC340_g6975 [Hortaea werneckii]KAI7397871.1 hypothetical protein KC328_g4715 [Hortaea werneckii]
MPAEIPEASVAKGFPRTRTRPTSARSQSSRATTSITTPTTSPSYSTTPLLARPLITRSATTQAALPQQIQYSTFPPPQRKKPSLFRRATDLLDLRSTTSYTARNAPTQPSHWTDYAHRNTLIKSWDAEHSAAAQSKYSGSITAQLVSTQKIMLVEFPELAEGPVPLSHKWIEYVLGISLRHPFCTAEKMGRYEVLASSGGARANWGPW